MCEGEKLISAPTYEGSDGSCVREMRDLPDSITTPEVQQEMSFSDNAFVHDSDASATSEAGQRETRDIPSTQPFVTPNMVSTTTEGAQGGRNANSNLHLLAVSTLVSTTPESGQQGVQVQIPPQP